MSALPRHLDDGMWSAKMSLNGAQVPRPGPVHGAYPLGEPPSRSSSPWLALLQAWWQSPGQPKARHDKRFLRAVRRAQDAWHVVHADQRAQQVQALRLRLGCEGFTDELTASSFGLISDVIRARMGFQLHDVQLLAARWMLGQRLVEMATGEGKTLTVLLMAATGALAGVPVHVLTANDYLARRDAQQMAPVYAELGLSVSFVTSSSTPLERKQAYLADVVHVTAKEVAFDHLRDRAARMAGDDQGIVLRGLCMAVIDEADSILIDEACTPLVLARPADQKEADQRYRLSLFLARQLNAQEDFVCADNLQVRLTEAGQDRLTQLGQALHGPWQWRRYRYEQVVCALQALHAFRRDVHYLVRDDAIHIIDETTGRLSIGRAWSRGLHQMIAIKEGVTPQPENETLTQTSFQAFFPRYVRLAGLSGTINEDRTELLRVYGLPTSLVPLRTPSRRVDHGLRLLNSAELKWLAVAEDARQASRQGRPVLIGTDTVADSDAISRVLTAANLPHQVLNARQDEAQGATEQAVIARAGLPACITVATHMAGRGTDVHLNDEALANGGLHVINTHLNPSRRIDRQLVGRCARQGAPGSCLTILSWDDACWQVLASSAFLRAVAAVVKRGLGGEALRRWLCRHTQMLAEANARQRRWALQQTDVRMARQLAMAGREDWA